MPIKIKTSSQNVVNKKVSKQLKKKSKIHSLHDFKDNRVFPTLERALSLGIILKLKLYIFCPIHILIIKTKTKP